jgi:predicted porin
VAAVYRNGDWAFGAGYANRTLDDETVVGGSDEVSVWGVTVSRSIGPGISLAAGVRVFDITDDDNAVGAQNSATNVFVKTGLRF